MSNISYKLDGQPVNKETLIASILLRIVVTIAAFTLIALSVPFTALQVFGVGIGIGFLFGFPGLRDWGLTVSDR